MAGTSLAHHGSPSRHAGLSRRVTDTTPGDHGRLIDRLASPCPPTRVDSARTSAAPSRQRSHVLQARAQASQIRADTKSTDLRRLAAAGLSAVVPGLGQLFNRRPRLAAIFLVPSLILIAVALLLILAALAALCAGAIAVIRNLTGL